MSLNNKIILTPFINALVLVRHCATREGACIQYVQAISFAFHQYDEGQADRSAEDGKARARAEGEGLLYKTIRKRAKEAAGCA